MENSRPERLRSIDALRGLAVLLMVDQHVLSWLAAELNRSQILKLLSAPGGLAAPIFIVLAGLGVTLASSRYEARDRLFIARGFGIIGFGYLLNILTPSWFSVGSWYVLHMIGFGIIISPVLKRLSSPVLGGLVVAVLIATVLIQNGLDTPMKLYNRQMSTPDFPGGMLRHALAEGFFPVFPWSSFFVAGVLAGRWLMRGNLKSLRRLAILLFLASVGLASCYLVGPAFTRSENLIRVFKVVPTFYPSLMPMSLFLLSMASFLIVLFVSIDSRVAFTSSNPLVCLGRLSLTILIVHVVVVRESAVRFDFARSLSAPAAVSSTVGILVLFSLAAVYWRRIGFRYGAEWLLRRVAG